MCTRHCCRLWGHSSKEKATSGPQETHNLEGKAEVGSWSLRADECSGKGESFTLACERGHLGGTGGDGQEWAGQRWWW